MDEKIEQLCGMWSKLGLPQSVSQPDAQPRSLPEIENACRECMDLQVASGSTLQQVLRDYAETLIRNGWTASDAEEAITAAIININESLL